MGKLGELLSNTDVSDLLQDDEVVENTIYQSWRV